MSREGQWFDEDLAAEGYVAFVRGMRSLKARFGFIVRVPKRRSHMLDVSALVDPMKEDLISMEEGYTWPGTRKGKRSQVFRFRLTSRAETQLVSVAASLFEWGSRPLPEDLFFEREHGTALLTTITHEKEGWLTVTRREAEVLRAASPALAAWPPLARS
jgi:hypothetical protein